MGTLLVTTLIQYLCRWSRLTLLWLLILALEERDRVFRRLIQRGELGQFECLKLEKVGFLIGLVYGSNKFLFVSYMSRCRWW